MTHKRAFVLLILAALGLLVVACGGGGAAAEPTEPAYSPQMIAEGEQLFVTNCTACHGLDATGLEGLGKDLTNSEFIADLSDEEFLDFVLIGRPSGDPLNTTGIDMPPKAGNPAITDDQILAIIAYVRSIQQ